MKTIQTRLRELQVYHGPFTLCLLGKEELSDLAALHARHPAGIPDDVLTLFTRACVARRILTLPRGNEARLRAAQFEYTARRERHRRRDDPEQR